MSVTNNPQEEQAITPMGNTTSPHTPPKCGCTVKNIGYVNVSPSFCPMHAAAREMLAMLHVCQGYIAGYLESTDPTDPAHAVLDDVRRAIAKAEGKA